jgi:hypothetical protein
MDCICRILVVDDLTVVLWLHTAKDSITPTEWDEAMSRVVGHIRDHAVSPDRLRSLVVSDGGAPSAAQRADLNERFSRGTVVKNAVVTTVLDNPIKRGIATALAWVNPGFRFYQPSGFLDGVAHLDLAAHRDALWAELVAMQLLLPPNRTLALIAASQGLPLDDPQGARPQPRPPSCGL